MKKMLLYLCLIFLITSLNNTILASSPSIRDIVSNVQAYKGQELTVAGTIIFIIDRTKSNLTVISLDKPKDDTKKQSSETDLYLLNDGTEGLYIVSTKSFEEKQEITFKAKILLTSKDKIDNDSIMLFDQNISKKMGFSSPGYSKLMLQDLISKLPKDRFWILLVDVEQ